MTVSVTKPAINVREELADLRKPTGIAGEAMLRAETPQEQFNLIGAGRRNLIINGAMQVAQRGTSASLSGNGFTIDTVDRMKVGRSGIDNLGATVSQATDAPSGFSNSFKLDVTTAESSIASDEYYRGLQYTIEGHDLAGLGYGTSGAQSVTLSFWVKSSVTGKYALGVFRDEATDRVYATHYTVYVAGAWEYKTITIEGDTTDAITADNGNRFSFSWYLIAGSNYTGGNIVGWETYGAAADLAAHHEVSWGTSTDDYWQITGVQLELGKIATPFEHRSYGEELALCQRYYEVLGQEYNASYTGYLPVMQPDVTGQAARSASLPHQVTKRAVPTVGDIDMQYYTGSWVSVSNVLADGVNYTRVTGASSSGHSLLRGRVYADAEL